MSGMMTATARDGFHKHTTAPVVVSADDDSYVDTSDWLAMTGTSSVTTGVASASHQLTPESSPENRSSRDFESTYTTIAAAPQQPTPPPPPPPPPLPPAPADQKATTIGLPDFSAVNNDIPHDFVKYVRLPACLSFVRS
jgi:hypothetical protein